MKTRVYKTIKGMARQSFMQFTFDNVQAGHLYVERKGWIRATLTNEALIAARQQIADILGGRDRERILRALNSTPSHWSFSRFIWNAQNNNFYYCAGQDYPSELASIRRDLYARA